jgi:transposase-like protein
MNTDHYDGAILEKEIGESKISYSEVARKLGSNRKTLYNWFEKEKLTLEVAKRISDIIHVDLLSKFPNNFKKEITMRAAAAERLKDAKERDAIYWKEKYFDLLERHNAVLEASLRDAKKS